VLEYQYSTKWSLARDDVPTRICTKKSMLTVFWRIDRFHVAVMMPPGGRFNTEYFLTHITDLLVAKVFPEGRKSHALRLSIHLDNCRVHSSNASKQFLKKILSSLFLIRHPVPTWRHPTSGSSAIFGCSGPVFTQYIMCIVSIISDFTSIYRTCSSGVLSHPLSRSYETCYSV
jgi:hypothetical protein